MLDHSMLKPESTQRDIEAGIDVVRALGVGFYCVQPCWVKLAARELAGDAAAVVSVVGFPHGCDVGAIKARAAELAATAGAREIDMVIDIGALRSGRQDVVAADIDAVLETSALDDTQKRLACRIAVESGAAFVKTSTGFHPSGGATVPDVRLLRLTVGDRIGVKASGGIRTLADAMAMIDAGANRIGTSASAAILAAMASDP